MFLLVNPLLSPGLSCPRVKLEEGPASWKVEALVLVGTLQIMTVKLLPIFLRCLQDDFVVVRKQACLTAATLMMKDEMVTSSKDM